MEIRLINRNQFHVCGYAVETTLEKNDQDVSGLFQDFFKQEKDKVLMDSTGAANGFYGLSWYTSGHERYCYLLGVEISETGAAPEDSLVKTVPSAAYAVVSLPESVDIIQAWTEFFYTDIPGAGLAPDEQHGYYFEFYPDNVHGAYELWVPVVKAAAISEH